MSYKTAKKVALLVLVAALILCVSGKVFAAKPADETAKKEKPAPVTKEALEKAVPAAKEMEVKNDPNYNPKEVIAKVGDAVLTREKINWMQENASPEIVKKIADWWIETELLYREALKSKDMFKDDQDKYMFDLQCKKTYVVKFVDYLQMKDFVISDEEAKDYYEKNKATDISLQSLGQATFSHIESETLEKAQEVLEKLKAGADIKELAKTESVAKDAKQGGYVIKMGFGVIQRRFGLEIAAQIEKAELNKFIGPLKNKEEKYEIFSVESLKKTEILSFEKARSKINATLLGKKREQYFTDYRENLKKDNAGEIYRSPILDKVEDNTESDKVKEQEKK